MNLHSDKVNGTLIVSARFLYRIYDAQMEQFKTYV